MKAYYYDNLPGDPRLPHMPPNTNPEISSTYLSRLGITYAHLPSLTSVDELASQRHYNHRDEITVSPSALGESYSTKIRTFFEEHLHEDEEIRYVLEGQGYFDVRGREDEWVRIKVEKGDLLILPPGIYHRFTTDDGDYIRALRLFKDEPKWTPLMRGDPGTEGREARGSYLREVGGRE